MPIRKRVSYVGYKDFQYRIIDTDPISANYFNVVHFPERLTAGKNLIKIQASAGVLVENAEIYIEVLDFNGNPIYVQPLRYIEKDGTRVISIYVYPDTSPGPATVYLASRALVNVETGEQIPFSRDFNSPDFYQIPNVIWSRRITVAPDAPNDSEIIFTQQPGLTITENVQGYTQPVDLFNVATQSLADGASITITPYSQIGFTGQPGLAAAEGEFQPGTPSLFGDGVQFFDVSPTVDTVQATQGLVTQTSQLYTLSGFSLATITGTGFTFSNDMVGGILTLERPSITTSGTPDNVSFKRVAGAVVVPESQGNDTQVGPAVPNNTLTSLSGSIRFAIANVISSTQALVGQVGGFRNQTDNTFGPFSVKLAVFGDSGDANVITTLNASTNFTASYIDPVVTALTQRSASFADIILRDIEPATGDVYKVRTQYKPTGFFGDFVDLGDTILELQDVLIDTGSIETNVLIGSVYENYGIFDSLEEIEQYWTTSSIGTAPTAQGAFQFDNDTIIAGAKFVPDYGNATITDAVAFNIKPEYQQTLYANTEYVLRFRAATTTDTFTDVTDALMPSPRLDVYISGSAGNFISIDDESARLVKVSTAVYPTDFNTTVTGVFADGNALGTRIGTALFPNATDIRANFEYRFRVNQTAKTDIKFVTRKGMFILSDIRLFANKETGFSPNFSRIFKRVPSEHLNTPLTFRFQFFNQFNRKADLELRAFGAVFQGDNTYIQGNFNLITGSIYLNNEIGGGIEMAGVNSGYIRTVGYRGFTSASAGTGSGFMLYSGSVLPDETNDYVNRTWGFEAFTSPENYIRIGKTRTGAETFLLRSKFIQIDGGNNKADNNIISGSIKWIGINEQPYTRVLVVDAATGQVAYTSSAAFGGGGGGGDNLGNHIATQDLNMSGFSITSSLDVYASGTGSFGVIEGGTF